MGSQSHAHRDKVKVTIECTADERAYIKMLAAKAHLTLSDLVLSYLKIDFPKKPHTKTLQAHEEALHGKGFDCDSVDDFWKQMGITTSAFT